MRVALGVAAAGAAAVVVSLALVLLLSSRNGSEAADWEQVASMPQRRSYIAAAQVGDTITAAGGMVGESGRPLAVVTRYHAADDRWETLRRLPVATRAAAGAALGETVYVIGGTTPVGNTTAVWALEGGEWVARAPLPGPRFNHSAIAFGGRIYVLGGFVEGEELRDVLVYVPAEDAWQEIEPLPRRNHAFGVVAFEDELWVIGGRRGEEILSEVSILDPRTGRWREGPAMPKPMELLGAAVVGAEIHAVWESTYQIYDHASGEWRDGPTPGVTRHALQAFHAGGFLFTIGGCTTALQDSPIVERLELS